MFVDVFYRFPSKPTIDGRLIGVERLNVSLFLWTECLDRRIAAPVDTLGWVVAERVRIVTDP